MSLGIEAVIGSGATYSEYLYTGAGWVLRTSPWQAVTPASGFTGSGTPAGTVSMAYPLD